MVLQGILLVGLLELSLVGCGFNLQNIISSCSSRMPAVLQSLKESTYTQEVVKLGLANHFDGLRGDGRVSRRWSETRGLAGLRTEVAGLQQKPKSGQSLKNLSKIKGCSRGCNSGSC